MEIWIPKKDGIESLLRQAADKVNGANMVSNIEEWLVDELSSLECHVSNRAGVERGEIEE